jgi:DegV family protein with EDD domain
MVRIVTDSTADIPAEMLTSLDIAVVPSYVTFGAESYRDGVDLTNQQFYEKLLATRQIPVTAAPPPAVYEQTYRRLLAKTDEIVSIHLASNYSGLFNSALVAAKSISEARIVVIDSEQVTMGYGWMVVAAAEAAQSGQTLEQIVALVEGMKPRARVLALLDSLDFLYRGGRVDWMRAMVGALLRIKPIVEIRMGQVTLLERARTLERSLERLMVRVAELGPLERVIVLHANAPDLAQRVADQVKSLIPQWDPLVGQTGVTVASHAGPGAVGIACIASS